MSMLRTLATVGLLLPFTAAGAPPPDPRFNAAGLLNFPADYREWIYVSTGFDMSYSEGRTEPEHSVFDNVFVDRASWATFTRTGHWPDGTMLVLEVRSASTKGSILKQGAYQTDGAVDVEVHLRDEARFEGGWAFFAFDGSAPAKALPQTERCYACHQSHALLDTTFTQFYPTARALAVKAGTWPAEPPTTP